MKHKPLIRFTILFITLAISCVSPWTHAQIPPASQLPVKIEVLYLHTPNRCPSCVAADENTRLALQKYFKKQMANGIISFASLDLKEEKNKALVEKYEIVFPTLLIIQKNGSNENKTDFSATAFQYAYTEPARYKALLRNQVKLLLDNK